MESTPSPLPSAPAFGIGSAKGEEERGALNQVDPFLLEALENPRHRLTVLRMELDIQQFMQNTDQHQFEFQPFSTSYLRCAAHRVAQHYGLQTMSIDNATIAVRKTPESRYPPILLSEMPLKQHENEKSKQIKIVVRRKLSDSLCDASKLGGKSILKTVEERMEDYDRARARIFSCSSQSHVAADSPLSSDGDEKETCCAAVEEPRKTIASRIAIFRDREKDLSDPDYDRSYSRYVSGLAPSRNFATVRGTPNSCPPSPVMHDGALTQPALKLQALPIPSNFGAVGCSSTFPGTTIYMHWPTPSMMYVQSYEHLRNSVFQAPAYQQHPFSLNHLKNS